MRRLLIAVALLAPAAPAAAQLTSPIVQQITGTRLDLSVTGEVTRVPDLAIINAGVVTHSPTAAGAIADNAAKMSGVIAALRGAGIADADIQTSAIGLSPQYRYPQNEPPQLTGYSASNQLTIKFRDIRNSGKILDALVAQGVNQISGPDLTLEHPEEALDEARAKAVAIGRARAELYARSLGLHVARVVSVSESSEYAPPPPRPMMAEAIIATGMRTSTPVEPGQQKLQVTLSMTFELR